MKEILTCNSAATYHHAANGLGKEMSSYSIPLKKKK